MIEIRIIYIVATIVVIAIVITFVLIAYRTFIQRIINEQKTQHQLEMQFQKNMLELSIKIQEDERKRIAAILHDDVGNKLNILSVWLNNPKAWNSEHSREIVLKQMPDIIETTRNVSHTLYPATLERLGLILTIDELIANVGSSLLIRLILLHKYKPNDIQTEVQIYRIIQEFLSNVIKHAEASEMIIHIREAAKTLYIILSDNGKGFDLEQTKTGMGLGNIKFRLNSLNASFKWKSSSKKGSKLIIAIPENE